MFAKFTLLTTITGTWPERCGSINQNVHRKGSWC